MDSAVLLDLLGNENRRRILRLLSQKPCYVTEISEYLGVSPKAVIDHLAKLEEAGLIENHTDDQRRKYFYIARSLRLEVSVSPYTFGTKSAYPASRSLDMSGRCPHLSIETDPEGNPGSEIRDLIEEYDRLAELENELSLAQRWVHGRLTETLDRLNGKLGTDADNVFYVELLSAVDNTDGRLSSIVDSIGAPAPVVEDSLQYLRERGLVTHEGDRWTIDTVT